MTPAEQLDLVKRHYALNGAGDCAAAEELLTDDFTLTIPSYMPFGGVFKGKGGMRDAIASVTGAVKVDSLRFLETTLGENCAIEIVEFTLAGDPGTTQVAELFQFRGNQICKIQPFYSDANAFIAAVERQRMGRG